MTVSIHAPAWGATRPGPWPAPPHRFNSRSRMGSDILSPTIAKVLISFNSRSRMGSDASSTMKSRFNLGFQFTLPHGERPR